MKKYYCDHCGKDLGSEPANRLALVKPGQSTITCDTFHFCDKCREEFFGWLNGKCLCQQKTVKVVEAKPAKKSGKKSNAYTVAQIAEMSGAPLTTVRRHMEGICSTYDKDTQGRTIRYYHLTEEQLTKLVDKIKTRKQGSRTKI